MKVKTWGTRGSVPVSNPLSCKYGGNTTCIQVYSKSLPPGMILLIDAGSGIIPVDMVGVSDVLLLMTHHHHDHTQGFPLCAMTYNKKVPISVIGPVQEGCGPAEVFHAIMRKPFFPVQFEEVSSHFAFYSLAAPASTVLLCHPVGGFQVIKLSEYERNPHQLSFGRKGAFPSEDCLIVFMQQTVHPESTISYRIEERISGTVFCFLTDHENQDGIPTGLRKHLTRANLLIEDTQYDRTTYERFTSGFGHATPDYAVRLANLVEARRLGLTHHDPRSNDEKVEAILADAQRCAQKARDEASPDERNRLLDPEKIFACADYMEIEV